MCVAKFVDFHRTGRVGSPQPRDWREGRVTYNVFLREGRLRTSDYIFLETVGSRDTISQGLLRLKWIFSKFGLSIHPTVHLKHI